MMNYEEFKQDVADHIKDFLPEKYDTADVSIHEVVKNNDVKLDGLVVRLEDSNVSPNVYLNDFFEQYENGRPMDDIMQNIADLQANNRSVSIDVSVLTDLENIKDKIAIRLVNDENNAERLSNMPHEQFEDLAIAYCINIGSDAGGSMSTMITDQLLDAIGISADELHDLAMNNLSAIEKPELTNMRDMLIAGFVNEMVQDGMPKEMAQQMAEQMMPSDMGGMSMYVVSNESKINGANVILDTDFMDQVADKLGGDFFVLPSSVHECIVIPKEAGMSYKELEGMVNEVNANEVKPEERLSNHVYEYDSKEHELMRSDKAEEIKAERAAEPKEKENIVSFEAKTEEKKEKTTERVSIKEKLEKNKAVVAKNDEKKVPSAEKKKEASL